MHHLDIKFGRVIFLHPVKCLGSSYAAVVTALTSEGIVRGDGAVVAATTRYASSWRCMVAAEPALIEEAGTDRNCGVFGHCLCRRSCKK